MARYKIQNQGKLNHSTQTSSFHPNFKHSIFLLIKQLRCLYPTHIFPTPFFPGIHIPQPQSQNPSHATILHTSPILHQSTSQIQTTTPKPSPFFQPPTPIISNPSPRHNVIHPSLVILTKNSSHLSLRPPPCYPATHISLVTSPPPLRFRSIK